MNLVDIQRCSSDNLRQTYFSLGLAIPNTTLIKENGFQACIGDFEHPICNFAAGLKLDPWSTRQLALLASTKRSFNVYALPGDEPEHVGELLLRSDFSTSYRLAQLTAEPCPSEISLDMRQSSGTAERLDTAKFMTEQFFPRQTEGFRRRVALATASALELDLFDMILSKKRVGAIMICQSDHVIGIYNLCISTAKRGSGLGRLLTQWALSLAHRSGKLATLQCDGRLQHWYEEQGFCRTGTVDVYTLSKSTRGDIIDV